MRLQYDYEFQDSFERIDKTFRLRQSRQTHSRHAGKENPECAKVYNFRITVFVKFIPPPGISQRFLGQVSFGGAVTRMSFLDRSNSGGGNKFDKHGNVKIILVTGDR